MEVKEGLNGTLLSFESAEKPSQYGSTIADLPAPAPVSAPESAPAPASAPELKKKRGRPRKYAPDGSIAALSPTPISSSIPLTGNYSTWGRADEFLKKKLKKHKVEYEIPGGATEYSGGGSFTPHLFTVDTGEDVNMKIISFSQQTSRAICVLAANGAISNVTLRQPNSFGGTLTYEGRFELLSLTGSFIPSDNGSTKSRSGGMSVSLAGPDGRVLGGGLAGMLVAAGPVQVVIGSFLTGNHQQDQQKPKKQKYEHTISFTPPVPSNPVPQERYGGAHNVANPVLGSTVYFNGDNLSAMNTKSNVSNLGEDSREHSQDLTC